VIVDSIRKQRKSAASFAFAVKRITLDMCPCNFETCHIIIIIIEIISVMLSQNRMLRRIFGPKRDGVTGGWRKLYNEELHNLYSSPNIIRIIKSRRMRWAGYVARMGEKRNVYRLLIGKPEGKTPLGRPRRRWIDNIKMDLLSIGLSVVDWIWSGSG
jgi:hypothetical protein